MKSALILLSLVIVTTIVSCEETNSKKETSRVKADNLHSRVAKLEQAYSENRRKVEEKDHTDSILFAKILQDALKIANRNISKEKFIEKYEVYTDSIPVSVEINLDYHFSKTNPHLIIHRNEPNAVKIDIYTKGLDKFEKVVSHEEWIMTYVNDTIKDINGDGLNDFVVNWYGNNGCCLKAFSDVYLLKQNKKGFSEEYEFINPTFSPREKIIRGVCYGHPGETAMYKYKWDGEKIDTVEYVSYETNTQGIKTGKILVSKEIPNGSKFKTLKILNAVPTEYKKIEGYYWFAGNL